jgi:hypothetical protein
MSLSHKTLLALCVISSHLSYADSQKTLLIRDSSWSSVISSSHASYYTLLPESYADKITFEQEEFKEGAENWIFADFAALIPQSYNINLGKACIWHLDPVDALYVGLSCAHSDITEAALNKLHKSKAIIPSGHTADIREQGFEHVDNIDINQFISINAKAMSDKINRMRVNRTFNIPNLLLGLRAINKIDTFVSQIIGQKNVVDACPKNTSLIGKLFDAGTIAFPVVRWMLSCKVQHIYITGYIKNFELLVNYKKGSFDKKHATQCLQDIGRQITRFGFGKKYAQQLEKLRAQINKKNTHKQSVVSKDK